MYSILCFFITELSFASVLLSGPAVLWQLAFSTRQKKERKKKTSQVLKLTSKTNQCMSVQYLDLCGQFHFSIIHIFPQIINFTALCHNLDYQLIL